MIGGVGEEYAGKEEVGVEVAVGGVVIGEGMGERDSASSVKREVEASGGVGMGMSGVVGDVRLVTVGEEGEEGMVGVDS